MGWISFDLLVFVWIIKYINQANPKHLIA